MHSQETPPAANKPPAQQATAKFWLLTLMTLALIGAGGVVYYRTELLNQNVAASLLSFTHETQWNKHQISDVQNELTLLQQRLQQEESVVRRQAQTMQEWRGLSQVGPSNRSRDRSAILDAHYFVRKACDQLILNKDLPQTLVLLTQAQAELNRVSDPQALSLKKALTEDLAALKAVPTVDTTPIYLRITALQQQIGKLPLLVVPVQKPEPVAAAASTPTTLWERSLDRIWRVLRQMVIVYHLPTAETPPFITPDRRPYLYENVQASLSNAGWAVLHHDSEVYQATLEQAATWVGQYFSLNSPLTKAALAELQALQTLPVQPAKDVVLLSPKAFDDYFKAESTAATSNGSS